jgi:RNA polymerase sigma-70 factor (ECF subfamily)
MNKDIHDCLVRAAEGDMGALGEIYDMLSVRMFNYARAITKSKEMSEDITHDVFMQIQKQSPRLAAMTNPIAYILVAVRNHAYDTLKRNKHITASLDEAPGVNAAPLDRLLIEDALSRLPANQRETVYLHHVCGFTQKEAAKIMGVPLVTVKWRCGKAKSQLQAYFNQTDKEEKCNEAL